MHKGFVLTAATLMIMLLSLQAGADCKEKLAELDLRMASPQIDSNQRNAMQMFRDQAARMCDQGNDATAMQTLGILEMMLPPSQEQQQQAATAREADEKTKSRLNDQFLEGVWCSMTGEERAQLVFSANGSYRPCFPSSGTGGYGQCVTERSTAEWLAGYDFDKSLDPNRIELGSRQHPGSMVYLRGECASHGR
jgi:hypothetical protein